MQLSWLHGRPKKHKDEQNPLARVEQYSEGHYHRRMPPINGFEYLVTHWHECGINSDESLKWSELRAYSIQSGATLEVWESKQIMKMSRAFISFKSKADDIRCPAPYRPEMTEAEKLRQADDFKAEMNKLKSL